MPDHHVCTCSIWHRVCIGGVVTLWVLVAPVGAFRLVAPLPVAPLWSFLAMVGALIPGVVLVKGITAWRCQPWPKPRTPWRVYTLVAVSLLPRDHR